MASSRPVRPVESDWGCLLLWIPVVLLLAGLASFYFAPWAGGMTFLVGLAGTVVGFRAMSQAADRQEQYRAALASWHREIAPPGYDAWRRLVEAGGLTEFVSEFEDGVRTAFRGEPSDEPGTRSRFGGHPDLPVDFVWPGSEKKPWMFFFQVACEELPEAKHELPRDGTLAVFTEEPFDHDSKTFYFPAGAPLIERAPPAGSEGRPPVPICFRVYEDIPDVDGCDEATTAEIREYLAGDCLALHCHGPVLWRARDGYGMLMSVRIDAADLRARDFSRVSPYY